jgi:hypothetical protein
LLACWVTPSVYAVEVATTPPFSPSPQPLFKDKLSVHIEQELYHWRSDASGSGRQSFTPITVTYRPQESWEVGLRTAYIDSTNKTAGKEGKVATWSDTSISVAKSFNQLSWPVRVNLDYNAPTGKATLAGTEKNAIMDGTLVGQTRFGEGENVALGVNVSKAVTKKDTFGAGISFNQRGAYDPNSDVTGDELNPGDETIATLQWEHKEDTWKIGGGASLTDYQKTVRGGTDYYKKGQLTDVNLTAVKALPKQQTLTVNARYTTQESDNYINNLTGMLEQEQRNSNGESSYVNLDYAKQFRRVTLHVGADYLDVKANAYDQENGLFNGGRRKTGYNLGADYALNKKSAIVTRLRSFEMTDNPTPDQLLPIKYKGETLHVGFHYDF